ncbi:MAG: hypothetical protein LBI69_00365 [Puniceicoccales bacterium]|nr:hypothetical protein [Puniceicoccales bacterium]
MTPMFDLRSIAADCGGEWMGSPESTFACGFSIDTRVLKRGEIFVALRTDRDDGHRYLEAAKKHSAAAAIVETYQEHIDLPQLIVNGVERALRSIATAHRQRFPNPVIAVAGSYGKTTTKELLALLLGRNSTFATMANENNTLGVPLNILQWDEKKHRCTAMEVGISRPGEMEIISSMLRPNHVLFTSISKKHGEFFPSIEELFKEKAAVANYIIDGNGFLFTSSQLANLHPLCDVPYRTVCPWNDHHRPWIRYGLRWNGQQLECRLHFQSPTIADEIYTLPVPSEGFAYDFSLCRALAQHLQIPRDEIAARLSRWQPPPLRGEIFCNCGQNQTFFADCYNSDAPALVESLRIFYRKFPHGPRYCVLGSMTEYGEETAKQHRWAGARIPFSPEDHYYFLGEEMRAMEGILLRRGMNATHMHYCDEIDAVHHLIKNLHGTIYLKGSRVHALERLIDFSSCTPITHE